MGHQPELDWTRGKAREPTCMPDIAAHQLGRGWGSGGGEEGDAGEDDV